jgi:hypothetical protein
MAVIGLVVATAYPLWGASALMVVALDHFALTIELIMMSLVTYRS